MSAFEYFELKNVGLSNNWAEFRGAIILANDHFSDHFRFRFWGEPKWARAIILADDHFSGYVLYKSWCRNCVVAFDEVCKGETLCRNTNCRPNRLYGLFTVRKVLSSTCGRSV